MDPFSVNSPFRNSSSPNSGEHRSSSLIHHPGTSAGPPTLFLRVSVRLRTSLHLLLLEARDRHLPLLSPATNIECISVFEDTSRKRKKKKKRSRQTRRTARWSRRSDRSLTRRCDTGCLEWGRCVGRSSHTSGAAVAFDMAASYLGWGSARTVIALSPHWQKVSTSPELFYILCCLCCNAETPIMTSCVCTFITGINCSFLLIFVSQSHNAVASQHPDIRHALLTHSLQSYQDSWSP